jgi:hypothetical protein
MISMVKLMRYNRTTDAKTADARSDTKLCTARTGGWSNGFRLRCRVGALFRQTDACPTIRWCLVMISMVKLMRYNCIAARRSFDENSDRTASMSLKLRSGSPVTVTVPAEAVGVRIKRLSQHQMMSGNVCSMVVS